MSKTKWYQKPIYALVALALVATLAIVALPMAGTVEASPLQTLVWGVTGVNFGAASEYSEVFTVDTATGAVTMVNNDTSNPLYSDIAVTLNGKLYAVGRDQNDNDIAPNGWPAANFDDFYRLDPATGAVLQTWSDQFAERVNALCAESDTSLLAIEGGGVCIGWGYATGPKLLRINLDAAGNFLSITNLGPIAALGAASCCCDGDLDKDPATGKWYAGFWASAGSEMLELNLANPGTSTRRSQSNIQWQGGFAFQSDGTAYAGSWADKNLYTVNVIAGGSAVAHDLSGSLGGNIFGLSSAPTQVEIDIKPGSDPNSINLKSRGVVPVVVLTTADFDASDVDPDTVVFAGATPLRWTMEDVDGDGDMDLLFHFKTQELNLDENSTAATLTGNTKGGQPIQGTDMVNIVPNG